MNKVLRYFDGEEIIKVIENENGITSIDLVADNKAIVITSDGVVRTVVSPYMELREQMASLDEALDVVNNIDF
ncbi:hypothetical protein [Carnobacterium divergens]|uniref:hypothetical protein n=1 Tax=Carnobacterium divergens TaxID=2748 RepID=UPI0039AEB27F